MLSLKHNLRALRCLGMPTQATPSTGNRSRHHYLAMSGQIDLYDLYDLFGLARGTGCEPHTVLDFARVSWVACVLYILAQYATTAG